MPPDVTHYVSSLTTCESACGSWDSAMRVSLDPARVSCPACVRRMKNTSVPEAALLRAVRQAASAHGWLCYHTHRSDHSEKGWPDIVLAKPGHPLFLAELKTAKGKLTMEQQRWMATLAQCTGIIPDIWRPADMPHILRLLAA